MLDDAQYLTGREKEGLIERKRRVSALFDVRQYILFGSKARGDAEAGSDIDLLIITKGSLTWEEKERITREVLDVNLEYDTDFSRTVVDAETWDSSLWSIVPLRCSVAKEGIVDRDMGDLYNVLYDERNEGDYKPFVEFSLDYIQPKLGLVRTFIERFERIVDTSVAD